MHMKFYLYIVYLVILMDFYASVQWTILNNSGGNFSLCEVTFKSTHFLPVSIILQRYTLCVPGTVNTSYFSAENLLVIHDDRKVKWLEAYETCRSDGQHLLTIKTPEKKAWIRDIDQNTFNNKIENREYWIGLNASGPSKSDCSEVVHRWVDDGTPDTWKDFYPSTGEPDNCDKEFCIRIHNLYRRTRECYRKYYFICEQECDTTTMTTMNPSTEKTTTTTMLTTPSTSEEASRTTAAVTTAETTMEPPTSTETITTAATPTSIETSAPPISTETLTVSAPSTSIDTMTTIAPPTSAETITTMAPPTSAKTITTMSPPTSAETITTMAPPTSAGTITTMAPPTSAGTKTTVVPSTSAETITTMAPPTSAGTITTMAPSTSAKKMNVSTSPSTILCINRNITWILPPDADLQLIIKLVNELKSELRIIKNSTSIYKRSKISWHDDRQSSQNIGAVGIAILVLFGVFVLALDFFNLKNIRRMHVV